jgi:hypothetical protein
MATRIFSFIALFGLLWVLPAYLLRPDPESIAVTYSGSYPVPIEIDFGDCYMSVENGVPKQKGNGCDDFGRQAAAPAICDVTFAFLPIERQVTRLRAKFALLKGGKEIGRGSVAVERLEYNAEENKWALASFRGKCDAEELRLLEAQAVIDGEPTNLIASERIRATGIIPWLPVGSQISIPEAAGG